MKTAATPLDNPLPLVGQRVRRARTFHRPWRIWLVSLLLLVAFAAFLSFAGCALAMAVQGDRALGVVSLVSLALFIVARSSAWILAQRLHCSLCHCTVMSEKRCRKHADAVRIPPLSYRATAVLQVLLTLGFRCMYCGTRFRLWK